MRSDTGNTHVTILYYYLARIRDTLVPSITAKSEFSLRHANHGICRTPSETCIMRYLSTGTLVPVYIAKLVHIVENRPDD